MAARSLPSCGANTAGERNTTSSASRPSSRAGSPDSTTACQALTTCGCSDMAVLNLRREETARVGGSAARSELTAGDGGLADLDQVTVGVADVGTDLGGVDLGLGQELGALGRPLRVGRGDVGHPEVEEGAGPFGVCWRGEGHRGLVVGRAAAYVEDEPAV